MRKPIKSYIYVITDGNSYKIGRADNVEKRLKGLATGNPNELSVVKKYEVSSDIVSLVESCLHNRFAEFNTKNEWFDNRIEEYLPKLDSIIDEIIYDIRSAEDPAVNKEKSPSRVYFDLRQKLRSGITREKVRILTTQCLLKGDDKSRAKAHVMAFFESIYTDAYNEIFEDHFEESFSEAMEMAKVLRETVPMPRALELASLPSCLFGVGEGNWIEWFEEK